MNKLLENSYTKKYPYIVYILVEKNGYTVKIDPYNQKVKYQYKLTIG